MGNRQRREKDHKRKRDRCCLWIAYLIDDRLGEQIESTRQSRRPFCHSRHPRLAEQSEHPPGAPKEGGEKRPNFKHPPSLTCATAVKWSARSATVSQRASDSEQFEPTFRLMICRAWVCIRPQLSQHYGVHKHQATCTRLSNDA